MVMKIYFFLLFSALPLTGMAQLLEFQSAKKLPSGINSTGEEGLPILSPDGKQLFFTRALYSGNVGGRFSGHDVWYSEFSSQGWKNSNNRLPDINNTGHNAIIGMSRDGNTRYFMNASPKEKMNGIYITKQINHYWTHPEFVPVPGIENQKFIGVFVSPDFDVMIFSMDAPDSRGNEDLYYSVKSSTGIWSVPKNMGATINTGGFEISPFLSADKKRLFFASNGHGGEGDADIFYSERLYNSWETWSLPVNLGKGVNSKKFDAYFSIYGDSIAYFASNRDGRFSDLYETKVAYGKTVLAAGQRYLSLAEWNRVIGKNVSRGLSFSSKSVALNASQRELLFFIANKLQLQKDIRFHLVVKEEETSAFTAARLNAISEYLIQSGIDAERIISEQVEPVAKSQQGIVEIRLIN